MQNERILVVEDEADAKTCQVLETKATRLNRHQWPRRPGRCRKPDLVISISTRPGDPRARWTASSPPPDAKGLDACVLMPTTTSISYVKVLL